MREVHVLAMIGTVTTKHGLVHAVRDKRTLIRDKHTDHGYYTACKRAYMKTSLDAPDRVVTCVWCVIGKEWPSGVTLSDPNTGGALDG